MSLTVTTLGVNSAFTTRGFQTNYRVRKGKQTLLVDCGTTAPAALERQGLSFVDVDSVYVSHLHLDHVGGLVQLGLSRFFAGKDRPKVFLHPGLVTPLWRNFLSGLMGRIVDKKGFGMDAEIEHFFDLLPLDPENTHGIGEIGVRLVEVQHVPGMPCHGIILDELIFLTTDTVFLPDLLERKADKFALESIFHDCSLVEGNRLIHTTLSQLESLPEDLKQLLVLTHFEDNVSDIPDTELLFAEEGGVYTYG